MAATVYGVPGSNATRAARLMLEHKGIAYRLVQLPQVVCRPLLRAMGFGYPTTPAIRLAGRKLQRTRAIARALEQLRPKPPLFPADPELRARVEEAERWGDEVLQGVARRLAFSAPVRKHARPDYASFFEGSLLGLPPGLAVAAGGPLLAANARLTGSADDAVRADLEALPGLIDRVDTLVARGTIGAEQANAADFQIAASARLLMCFDDLRPLLAERPAAELALRIAPDYPGRIRPVFPVDWLAPLRTSSGP